MKIYVEAYGCTANKSDERLLLGLLKEQGHQIITQTTPADVIILLTCTVIGTTEQRMLSRLKEFAKTQKKIVVTGCMPAVQADLIKSIVPAALLLPSQYIQYINDIVQGNNPAFLETKKSALPRFYDSPIAPILIAEGCTLSCSYCITHFARGVLRSFPSDEIVSDVYSALKQGCKEIQLTAQDTASYGLDTRTNLGVLLHKISAIEGFFRIRVGMMNPLTAQKNLTSIISAYQHPKVYKFLHLPVQSGDNDILKKMNRGYTVQQIKEMIFLFRSAVPNLTLSTDVILGFPTETEEQFDNTLQLIKDVTPDIINITRFSARPLTPAKKMLGRIPTHVVKDRSRQTAELCAKITLQKNKEHLRKTYHVLVTEPGKKRTVTARTDSYKQVVITEPIDIGSFARVKIIDAKETYLVGKLI
ncbi:MAG: tRNA (N(6)-L-threonylcarbamoyladenosine(37)-C(2))-methylthiotransferase [Candidatus Thermoplasmatota archaeon]|jgi:MiaB-like tRNA modifying enzyme|nr:tRNA (N(6)-L-threonylcarbamoyladenosine(37)-C(2))-methylthiotransferase [Candidatus Thermoplasmatota archaeon]